AGTGAALAPGADPPAAGTAGAVFPDDGAAVFSAALPGLSGAGSGAETVCTDPVDALHHAALSGGAQPGGERKPADRYPHRHDRGAAGTLSRQFRYDGVLSVFDFYCGVPET